MYGKVYADDGPRYRRLPESLHGVVRDALWDMSTNSTGLYIRFRTDAPEITAHWTNTGFHMPHMTDAGATEHKRKLVANMEPVEREYMLYLSLYDEVKTLELGVPQG